MSAPTGASTTRELRLLRARVTGLISLLTATIVIVFAILAIRLDGQLRDEQVDARLLGSATRAAGLVGFGEDGLDVASDDAVILDDDVLIGVRPEFDVITMVGESDVWEELPEMSDAEVERRVDELLDDLDLDEMADLLDLDRPIAESEMRDRLVETRADELFDEVYREFLFDRAEAEGVELSVPTELVRSSSNPLTESDAIDAIERVADDDVDTTFTVADGDLLVRGVPLRDGAEIRGAIIAVVDPTESVADQARFRRSIIGLGIGLVLVSAAAAWFVAGRTVRPAARALAQQERFLADAAHELRTPIAAIRATAEAHSDDTSGAALTRVSELAGGAAQLTDDLLTLARMDADRLTLVRDRVRLDLLVEALVDDDPSFSFVAERDVVIDADPKLVERAVDNLLRNARGHGEASAATPASVTVTNAGVVIVEDQGPGVEAELRATLFDRFRSGPDSTGHGLGLPLTRWIARAHGGECSVAKGSTTGAKFTVSFGSD